MPAKVLPNELVMPGVALFDAVAEQNPIVGRPVQALLNTQGYQDRETERQIRKEALLAERLRNQEYVQNASSREKGVKAQDLHNDEFIEGASSRAKGRKAQDLQADEFVQNASGRNAQRKQIQQLLASVKWLLMNIRLRIP